MSKNDQEKKHCIVHRCNTKAPVRTSNEGGEVVVDVGDGDGDGGGGRAAGVHPPHVLGFDHNHILAPGFPVQIADLAGDHTCEAETGGRSARANGKQKYSAVSLQDQMK